MTFRTRVAAAIAVVVAAAVLLACGAAYKAARDALVGSADTSLAQAYQQIYLPNPCYPGGVCAPQLRPADVVGTGILLVDPLGNEPVSIAISTLAVDTTIKEVAAGKAPLQYRTVTDSAGTVYRELLAPIPRGTEYVDVDHGHLSFVPLPTTYALVIVEPFQGVESRLRTLGEDLLILAALGILLAALFGWLAARAALVPLADTTREIEEVATTLDVSHRVEEGTDDELGRLRRAFNQLLAQVEASWESQRQLILDASHELRTPLTSLRANAQVLSRIDELEPEDATQLSGDMVAQVDELTSLVGDLTELTQGEHSVEEPTTFDLADLVSECSEVAETHARTKQVSLEVEVTSCTVRARRNRLARAVGNLLDNAIKFSPPGGTVAVASAAGEVVVEDQGPGIDEADLPRVFDRFYRSPRSRGLPGSGLGLAIVAQVANEAGGTVEVSRSESLGGARLVLRLPLAG
ncbi:MAG TPA: HAMP domain-containing sensor histidine kinase [Acidimicrobiales bacterium]|nr:HAMP domain-containing sensor histidine kinase [Acidimicrobiales bacterium]